MDSGKSVSNLTKEVTYFRDIQWNKLKNNALHFLGTLIISVWFYTSPKFKWKRQVKKKSLFALLRTTFFFFKLILNTPKQLVYINEKGKDNSFSGISELVWRVATIRAQVGD